MSHTTTSGDRADSERGKYWEKLAEEYGASYAVVIDHADQLQKTLTSTPRQRAAPTRPNCSTPTVRSRVSVGR